MQNNQQAGGHMSGSFNEGSQKSAGVTSPLVAAFAQPKPGSGNVTPQQANLNPGMMVKPLKAGGSQPSSPLDNQQLSTNNNQGSVRSFRHDPYNTSGSRQELLDGPPSISPSQAQLHPSLAAALLPGSAAQQQHLPPPPPPSMSQTQEEVVIRGQPRRRGGRGGGNLPLQDSMFDDTESNFTPGHSFVGAPNPGSGAVGSQPLYNSQFGRSGRGRGRGGSMYGNSQNQHHHHNHHHHHSHHGGSGGQHVQSLQPQHAAAQSGSPPPPYQGPIVDTATGKRLTASGQAQRHRPQGVRQWEALPLDLASIQNQHEAAILEQKSLHDQMAAQQQHAPSSNNSFNEEASGSHEAGERTSTPQTTRVITSVDRSFPPGFTFAVFDSEISKHYNIPSSSVMLTHGSRKYVDHYSRFGPQTKFRFQLCRNFLINRCSKGCECTYIHVPQANLPRPTSVHLNVFSPRENQQQQQQQQQAAAAATQRNGPQEEGVVTANDEVVLMKAAQRYETLPPGLVLFIHPPNQGVGEVVSTDAIKSNEILRTVGAITAVNAQLRSLGHEPIDFSDVPEANGNGRLTDKALEKEIAEKGSVQLLSATGPKPKHCAHFQFKKMCHLGYDCHFVHAKVPLSSEAHQRPQGGGGGGGGDRNRHSGEGRRQHRDPNSHSHSGSGSGEGRRGGRGGGGGRQHVAAHHQHHHHQRGGGETHFVPRHQQGEGSHGDSLTGHTHHQPPHQHHQQQHNQNSGSGAPAYGQQHSSVPPQQQQQQQFFPSQQPFQPGAPQQLQQMLLQAGHGNNGAGGSAPILVAPETLRAMQMQMAPPVHPHQQLLHGGFSHLHHDGQHHQHHHHQQAPPNYSSQIESDGAGGSSRKDSQNVSPNVSRTASRQNLLGAGGQQHQQQPSNVSPLQPFANNNNGQGGDDATTAAFNAGMQYMQQQLLLQQQQQAAQQQIQHMQFLQQQQGGGGGNTGGSSAYQQYNQGGGQQQGGGGQQQQGNYLPVLQVQGGSGGSGGQHQQHDNPQSTDHLVQMILKQGGRPQQQPQQHESGLHHQHHHNSNNNNQQHQQHQHHHQYQQQYQQQPQQQQQQQQSHHHGHPQ